MTGRAAAILAASFLVALAPSASRGQEPAPRPLRVRSRVGPGPYYVGQSIPLDVSVVAGGERPRVVTPRVPDAELTLTGTSMSPISSSGIGKVVFEEMAFVSRFRIVPRRSGLLVIPPFTARLGDRTGTSQPIRLKVDPLPDAGRTDAFVGGVGPFEVTAEVRPQSVRLGEVLEYCLHVTGPGARGMIRAPDAQKLVRGSVPIRVEAPTIESVAEPPSRRFCYRVRPLRAGDFVLPPITVASFDPRSGRYVTRASPGVPVHVVEVARFDPSSLDYRAPAGATDRWLRRGVLLGSSVVLLALFVFGGLALRQRRARRWRQRAPARLLARLSQAVRQDGRSAAETARTITEGISEYLQLTTARPLGALTPGEASHGIARSSNDDELGARAGRLVARCDRAQFGGEGPSARELADLARGLFADLGRMERKERFETPREAAATAPLRDSRSETASPEPDA